MKQVPCVDLGQPCAERVTVARGGAGRARCHRESLLRNATCRVAPRATVRRLGKRRRKEARGREWEEGAEEGEGQDVREERREGSRVGGGGRERGGGKKMEKRLAGWYGGMGRKATLKEREIE